PARPVRPAAAQAAGDGPAHRGGRLSDHRLAPSPRHEHGRPPSRVVARVIYKGASVSYTLLGGPARRGRAPTAPRTVLPCEDGSTFGSCCGPWRAWPSAPPRSTACTPSRSAAPPAPS